MKIASYALGFLAFVCSFSAGLSISSGDPIIWFSTFMTLVFGVLSGLAHEYQKSNYHGGIASVVGAVLVAVGVVLCFEVASQYWYEENQEIEVSTNVVLILLFVFPGLLLVQKGHKIHRLS